MDEMVYNFYHSPGAHVGRTFCLISELILIIFFVKNYQHNPVKYFKDDGAEGNSSIIGTIICGSTFVFDQQDDSTNQKTVVN